MEKYQEFQNFEVIDRPFRSRSSDILAGASSARLPLSIVCTWRGKPENLKTSVTRSNRTFNRTTKLITITRPRSLQDAICLEKTAHSKYPPLQLQTRTNSHRRKKKNPPRKSVPRTHNERRESSERQRMMRRRMRKKGARTKWKLMLARIAKTYSPRNSCDMRWRVNTRECQ